MPVFSNSNSDGNGGGSGGQVAVGTNANSDGNGGGTGAGGGLSTNVNSDGNGGTVGASTPGQTSGPPPAFLTSQLAGLQAANFDPGSSPSAANYDYDPNLAAFNASPSWGMSAANFDYDPNLDALKASPSWGMSAANFDYDPNLGSSLDPAISRKSATGLSSAASGPGAAAAPKVGFPGIKNDLRVRISLPVSSPLMSSPMFKPLAGIGGVIFPYVPSVTMTHKANYNSTKLTHSNYASYNYEGSEVSEIGITGDFSVQNKGDAEYLLAVIYFFRSVTKMFFGAANGKEDPLAGNPPPLVQLDGFGQHYFPGILCAVTSFSHSMPQDVDYIEITVKGTAVRLPTLSQVTVSLQPMYSRKNVFDNFSLTKFANGELLGKGGFV